MRSAEMLRVPIDERLVRPVGETYEIQHDRLAAAVIEAMKDSDREAESVPRVSGREGAGLRMDDGPANSGRTRLSVSLPS